MICNNTLPFVDFNLGQVAMRRVAYYRWLADTVAAIIGRIFLPLDMGTGPSPCSRCPPFGRLRYGLWGRYRPSRFTVPFGLAVGTKNHCLALPNAATAHGAPFTVRAHGSRARMAAARLR